MRARDMFPQGIEVMTMRPASLATIAALLLPGVAHAQDLRRAAVLADVVVVAKGVGTRPLGKDLIVHRLEIEATLKGQVPRRISVVERKRLSGHQRPTPARRRLYCLHDASARASRAGLPDALAPYFEMSGHRGSSPAVVDPTKDDHVELVRILLAAEAGAAARDTVPRLLRLALHGVAGVRTEAVLAIADRRGLRDAITPLQQSQITARLVGETEDMALKSALLELCALRRVPGLIQAVCLGADEVDDRAFWCRVGLVAARLHGEGVVDVLRPELTRARTKAARARILLVLGATGTESAVDALLRMRQVGGPDPAIDAALRQHGAPRARAALGEKRGGGR